MCLSFDTPPSFLNTKHFAWNKFMLNFNAFAGII